VTTADEETRRLLREGDLELLGLLPRSSNYTFLARVGAPEDRTLAVYKPERGETPLWDFPDGTLHLREAAAAAIADALGWPWVPPTIVREGPHGVGSVQLFVEFDPEQHYFTMRDDRPDDFRRIALFDVVVNNADRKSGHCLLSKDGRVFAIDHGVCLHHDPKLRTVIWDFADESIPPDLMEDLRGLQQDLADGSLGPDLGELLRPAEIRAAARRLEDLIRAGRFPAPGSGRPYPWPIV
jgi:hypothetical protein